MWVILALLLAEPIGSIRTAGAVGVGDIGLAGYVSLEGERWLTEHFALGARAHAFLNGRGYVTPQDVKSIGPDVLRHRIIVSYEAEAEAVTSETIIERIFAGLPVP